jgi:MYXO-CTERM domain-containing protein
MISPPSPPPPLLLLLLLLLVLLLRQYRPVQTVRAVGEASTANGSYCVYIAVPRNLRNELLVCIPEAHEDSVSI